MPFASRPGGLELYYEVHGDGPTLLLVSGTGHDHTFWFGQLPFFRARYRCVVFDNRGMGQSGVPPPGYRLADMADDAAAVLDAAGVARAHVMGFSMGGHISQELCLRHPERVLSLGLHHTWARNCPRLGTFQAARKRLAEAGDMASLADISILGLYAHDYFDRHPDELEQKRAWLIECSGPALGWIGQLEACLTCDTLDRLEQIRVPTLLSASSHDLIVGTHPAREMNTRIGGSRLEILEGTGHVALIEEPERFARLCLSFLDAQPR